LITDRTRPGIADRSGIPPKQDSVRVFGQNRPLPNPLIEILFLPDHVVGGAVGIADIEIVAVSDRLGFKTAPFDALDDG
jgi:hypothetical protein